MPVASKERFSVMGHDDTQQRRLADLSRSPAPNPAHLTRLVTIKRTGRGFCVGGRPIEPGEIVKVPYSVARDLVAMGKAELMD